MKTKGSVLLLFVFCCLSCDISTAFVIDGEKEYTLSNECGTIKIKGSSFSTSVFIGCTFNGKYFVNTDLLRMEPASNEDIITNIRFRLNKEEFTGKEFETKGGKVLALSYNQLYPIKNQVEPYYFYPLILLPAEGKLL